MDVKFLPGVLQLFTVGLCWYKRRPWESGSSFSLYISFLVSISGHK